MRIIFLCIFYLLHITDTQDLFTVLVHSLFIYFTHDTIWYYLKYLTLKKLDKSRMINYWVLRLFIYLLILKIIYLCHLFIQILLSLTSHFFNISYFTVWMICLLFLVNIYCHFHLVNFFICGFVFWDLLAQPIYLYMYTYIYTYTFINL